MAKVEISVVIPVYNEQDNLPTLFSRLIPSLDALKRKYEIIFTNDGSSDRSGLLLREFVKKNKGKVRVIDFNGNFGQHMAIIAAFERVQGDIVVTLDADLQNPPEEIHKLIEKIDQGFDSVGGYRAQRNDTFFRKTASKIINKIRSCITDIEMKDQGCMLRAYKRHIVDEIVRCGETATFIPALAYKLSQNPEEVEVLHEVRAFGESKYSLYKLIRLNFDLMTGFSLLPLQIFTLFGMGVSFLSAILFFFLLLRRLFVGPEAEGMFTLFSVLFLLMGIAIAGIGIVGEYVGRTYQAVAKRPRYLIREIVES